MRDSVEVSKPLHPRMSTSIVAGKRMLNRFHILSHHNMDDSYMRQFDATLPTAQRSSDEKRRRSKQSKEEKIAELQRVIKTRMEEYAADEKRFDEHGLGAKDFGEYERKREELLRKKKEKENIQRQEEPSIDYEPVSGPILNKKLNKQGHAGAACSTPQNVDHSMAKFRQLDISVVNNDSTMTLSKTVQNELDTVQEKTAANAGTFVIKPKDATKVDEDNPEQQDGFALTNALPNIQRQLNKRLKTKFADRQTRDVSFNAENLLNSFVDMGESPGRRLFMQPLKRQPLALTPARDKKGRGSDVEKTIQMSDVSNRSTASETSSYVEPVTEMMEKTSHSMFVDSMNDTDAVRSQSDVDRQTPEPVKDADRQRVTTVADRATSMTPNTPIFARDMRRSNAVSQTTPKTPSYMLPTVSSIHRTKNVSVYKTCERIAEGEERNGTVKSSTTSVLISPHISRAATATAIVTNLRPVDISVEIGGDDGELTDDREDDEMDTSDLVASAKRLTIAEPAPARQQQMPLVDYEDDDEDDDVGGDEDDNNQDDEPEQHHHGRLRRVAIDDTRFSVETPKRTPPQRQNFERSFDNDSIGNRSETVDEPDNQSDADVDENERIVRRGAIVRSARKSVILAPRKLIKPKVDNGEQNGVRRSTRTRVKPVRAWLGEQAVYQDSPSGGRKLVGVTAVTIKDRRFVNALSADPRVVVERENHIKAQRRQQAKVRKERKLRELRERHRQGRDLNVSQDSIVTSDDE